MASPIYDIETLVQLRNALPFVIFDIAKLNKHADIEAITSIPPQVFTDSSFETTTNSLAQPLRRTLQNSSEGTEDSMLCSSTIKRRPMQQQQQWQYRRRESSDRHQPLSAPTGFAAQQTENFQRFYRAVVSPTHVRVTAGGRIVPNTRPPPSWHWNGDKGLFEYKGGVESLFIQPVQHGNLTFMDGVTEIEHIPQAQQSVRLSHPTRFDAGKPFMYNNQLVYPVPAGALPISLVNSQQSFATHHQILRQPAMPVQSYILPTYDSEGMTLATSPAHHGSLGLGASSLPSVAEITKSQIQGLRDHLIHIEHRLANSKPNIDEAFMERQKRDIKTNIDVMEALFSRQIAQGVTSDNDLSVEITQPCSNISAAENPRVENKHTVKSSVGLKKSKLTASAPAFQPRSMRSATQIDLANGLTSTQAVLQAVAQPLVTQPSSFVSFKESEDDLLKHCRLDWNKVDTNNGHIIPGLAKASTLRVPTEFTHESTMLKRSKTFHGHSYSTNTQSGPLVAPNATPYLVGHHPGYIAGRGGRPLNYHYARPLTAEENRARQLYWGKIPRSAAQSGLPKFDGKDFYPSSPIKANDRASTSHEAATPLRQRPSIPLPHSFEDLLATSADHDHGTSSLGAHIYEAENGRCEDNVGSKASLTHGHVENQVRPTTHGHKHTNSYSHLFMEPNLMLHGPPKTPEVVKHRPMIQLLPSMAKLQSTAASNAVVRVEDSDLYSDSESDANEGIGQGGASLKSPSKANFAERIASFSKPEQQTFFLHNMLQNTVRRTLHSPTSPEKASATASQGYPPRYRGAATASLAPTVSNAPAVSGVMSLGVRKRLPQAHSASISMSENRPLFDRGNHRFTDMDAMSYMRQLAQKSSIGSKDGWETASTGLS